MGDNHEMECSNYRIYFSHICQFVGQYELLGILIAGFITGYIAKDGAMGGGLWNSAVAESLGTIITAITMTIIATLGEAYSD